MAEARRPADERVRATLKGMIEVNLAREKAISQVQNDLPGAWHSNGIIFSKSGNGTPFSNGIIFSKTGRVEIEAGDPGEAFVHGLAELDEAAFSAFTDRLLRLKQVKAAAQIAEIGH